MNAFLNPFPPVAVVRLWTEDFSQGHLGSLPDLEWTRVPGLRDEFLRHVPESPGIYVFIRTHMYKTFSFPRDLSIPVYVGKASKSLRSRIRDYLRDKKASKRRVVRGLIQTMFTECPQNLELWITPCHARAVDECEKILIELLDPPFNTDLKLDEQMFRDELLARIEPPVPAFPKGDTE